IDACFNLGVSYSKEGLLDEEILQYNKVLQLNPYSAESHFNLGIAYGEKKMFDSQINEYKKAIALNPNYVKAYKNLESIYREKGMKKEADKELLKYNELVKR
ncbi:MAG: tetratricopeptide repeat protein, partial [Planctomycetota bacterium]